MSSSNQMSVRIGAERLERLQNRCREADCDISHVVRQALDLLLASGPTSASANAPRRLNPPEEIMRLVPKYLAWANGDLRLERKKLFLELVAASFVCKKHYPRTSGILDGYEGLLQLCALFGVE